MTLSFGSVAFLRGRLGNKISGTSRATEGREHGAATTGKIGLGVGYQSERKTWREFFGWTPKAKLSAPKVQKNQKGGVTDISCTMTLPRKAIALKSYAVQIHLKDEQSGFSDAMIAAPSYTTLENLFKFKHS
ncbi:MAG: hypothetical protein RIE06_33400 [Roseibium album]|uniref:hypothetical protein n=1 Tax=Roseibium album TaxID=311410 RepID=UPI0032EC6118